MRPHYISTLRLYFDVGNSIYYSSWVHLYESSTGDNLGHQGWEPLGRGVVGEGVYEGLELDDPGQGGEGVQAGLSGWEVDGGQEPRLSVHNQDSWSYGHHQSTPG